VRAASSIICCPAASLRRDPLCERCNLADTESSCLFPCPAQLRSTALNRSPAQLRARPLWHRHPPHPQHPPRRHRPCPQSAAQSRARLTGCCTTRRRWRPCPACFCRLAPRPVVAAEHRSSCTAADSPAVHGPWQPSQTTLTAISLALPTKLRARETPARLLSALATSLSSSVERQASSPVALAPALAASALQAAPCSHPRALFAAQAPT
jgi:hypothetical protein